MLKGIHRINKMKGRELHIEKCITIRKYSIVNTRKIDHYFLVVKTNAQNSIITLVKQNLEQMLSRSIKLPSNT